MKTRQHRSARALAVSMACLWAVATLGGCVAILDVDSSDYTSLAEEACGCFDGGEACTEVFEDAFANQEGSFDKVAACLDDNAKCVARQLCIAEAGLCSKTFCTDNITCCGGATCQQNRCGGSGSADP